MKYQDFHSIAKKHSNACKVLRDKIESVSEENRSGVIFDSWVLSLYYLSGYIIECSIKFKILEVFNHCKFSDVSDFSCEEIGINYRKKFKTHNLNRLNDLLESKISGIFLKNCDTELNGVIDSWDPVVRYEGIQFDYLDVLGFHDHSISILKKV
ncbi:hypothetical protein [Paenalcaligenes faecalis]|uniref:hypothetical protein n=1 Tax=Paenalcaligenes faecalis TaxID=2980099 RepID=UPI0022B98DAF|nr:hypothetical protein [Paenalcaligenes faecalis]